MCAPVLAIKEKKSGKNHFIEMIRYFIREERKRQEKLPKILYLVVVKKYLFSEKSINIYAPENHKFRFFKKRNM